MATLLEFWNAFEPDSVFVVSTVNPGGVEYRQNQDGIGDDYCDLMDLIDTGLFPQNETGTQPWWEELNGQITVDGGSSIWKWDGKGDMRDSRGNSYLRIEVAGH